MRANVAIPTSLRMLPPNRVLTYKIESPLIAELLERCWRVVFDSWIGLGCDVVVEVEDVVGVVAAFDLP